MSKGMKPRLTEGEYREYIDIVLSTICIKDIINDFVPLVERKRSPTSKLQPKVEWVALCPFHTERSPSFTVTNVKQFYHCFGCGAHGDARNFLVEYCGMSATDALRYLARKAKYWPSDHFRRLKKRSRDKK